jgi:hypothetical protein
VNFSLSLVENATAAVFFSSLLISLWMNIKDWKRK